MTTAITPLEQWRHDSVHEWLRVRLDVEYRREWIRAQIRKAQTPVIGFRVDDQLRRLMLLK